MPTVNYTVNIQGGQGSSTLAALQSQAQQLKTTLGTMPVGGGFTSAHVAEFQQRFPGVPLPPGLADVGGGGGGSGWGGGRSGGGGIPGPIWSNRFNQPPSGFRSPFNPYGSSLARILPGIGAGYLALQAGQATAHFGATALGAESDPLLSAYEKDRKIKESVPILGGFVKEWLSFIDELSGFAPRVREMHRSTALALVRIDAAAHREMGRREDEDRLFSAQARLRYGGGAGLSDARARFTSGLRRPEDIERLDPFIYRQQVSERDVSVANAEQARSGVLAGGAISAMEQATREREIFEKDVRQTRARMATARESRNMSGGEEALRGFLLLPTSGLSYKSSKGGNTQQEEEALLLKQKSLTEAIRKEKEAINAAEAASKKNNQEIEASYEKQRQNIGAMGAIAQARLSLAEEERGKAKHGIAAFGLLRPEQRNAAQQAARKLAAFGPNALSDDELGLVHRAGVYEDLIQKAAIKSAEKDQPLLQEALRTGGMRGLPEINLDIENFKKEIEKFGELGPAMREMTQAWEKAIKDSNDDAKKWRDAQEANRNAEAQNKQLQEGAGAGK